MIKSAVLMRTFASTHTIFRVQNGEFLSLMDPPDAYREAAATCTNVGTWPVLVGEKENGDVDTILSSPIILYDYPQIAPESPGELFDGTEIDEILTLRVLTMTDEEKSEMSQIDEQARKILERTESLPEDEFIKMHGIMREVSSFNEDFFNPKTRPKSVIVDGVELKAGDRVRIRPQSRADVMDIALKGKAAVIESIEQDAEDRIYLALVLDEDPGKDLGFLRQPGHRFFYGLDEVEPLRRNGMTGSKRILVAGVGNIFLGDDAFGSEVARRLMQRTLPAEVQVNDYGTCSYDLAYAMMEDYEATILVDATSQGQSPGTVYLIEPDLNELDKMDIAVADGSQHEPGECFANGAIPRLSSEEVVSRRLRAGCPGK